MLWNLMGLGGRIGRMQYFLRSLGAAVAMAVMVFVLAMTASPRLPGDTSGRGFSPVGLALVILILVGIPFLWYTLMLHVKRIRDIGWRPSYVILGWIAVNVFDAVLVTVAPSLAIDGRDETWLAFAVNLLLVGCLLFWPGDGNIGDDEPHLFDTPYRAPTTPRSIPGTPRRSPPAPAPAPTGFGRRGL